MFRAQHQPLVTPPRRAARRVGKGMALGIGLLCAGLAVSAMARDPSGSDLEALKYYYTQNNQTAVDAELRRLKIQFPDWTPPVDLSTLVNRADDLGVDQLYALVAAGQYSDAEDKIAQTRAAHPDWQVPTDLIALLNIGRAQASFDSAIRSSDVTGAERVANAAPELISCDRVNNVWLLGQGRAAQGDIDYATRLFTRVVQTCTNFDEVKATIQKTQVLGATDVASAMIETALNRFPGRSIEINQLRPVTVLSGAAPADQAPTAPVLTTAPPPAAEPAPTAAQAPTQAPTQTKTAAAPVAKPKPSTKPPATRTSANLDAATQPRSGTTDCARATGSAALGWCAYDANRPLEALTYFQSAERGGNAAATRDARFGQALSYLKLGMTENAAAVAAATPLTDQQRRDVESIILDQRAVAAFKAHRFQKAIDYIDAYEQVARYERRDLAILRAFALMELGNTVAAHEAFARLDAQLSTPETRKGLRDSAK